MGVGWSWYNCIYVATGTYIGGYIAGYWWIYVAGIDIDGRR